MSIQAKKEGIFRILGMLMIFISLISSIIFDFYVLGEIGLYALNLTIAISWLILIALLKLSVDFFVENFLKVSIVLAIVSIIMIIIGSMISPQVAMIMPFVFISISNILAILCWQFSLSIYKAKKLFFIIGGLICCVFTIIFRTGTLTTRIGWLLGVAPLLLFALGICLVILAEMFMKKKGFLNYI